MNRDALALVLDVVRWSRLVPAAFLIATTAAVLGVLAWGCP